MADRASFDQRAMELQVDLADRIDRQMAARLRKVGRDLPREVHVLVRVNVLLALLGFTLVAECESREKLLGALALCTRRLTEGSIQKWDETQETVH